MHNFVHLRVQSDYSMGWGALKVKKLVARCAEMSMPAICLADKNNMFASLEFSLECAKAGIQAIMGCILTVKIPSISLTGDLLLIAKSHQGYLNLLQLVSASYFKDKGEVYINDTELAQYSTDIIALIGGSDSHIHKLLAAHKTEQACEISQKWRDIFQDRIYIELHRYTDGRQKPIENELLDIALKLNIPIVATNNVQFISSGMHEAHDALMCINRGRYILEDDREKSNKEHYFKSIEEMQELFHDLPEALENTINIAVRCSFMPESSAPLLPKLRNIDEAKELEEQSYRGLENRIRHIQDQETREVYFKRLNKELEIINQMQFPGYFLIVSDFIKWSKQHNIPVGPGRGSGAGSIVAWSLDITNLDPLQFGLLFERFLNPERVSMPDFDIDFCQERRDEVLQYVRKKYGADKVAHIVTFGKLQARAVLRDVGRVLHMPYNTIDKICKMVPNNPASPVTLEQAIKLDKQLQKSRDNNPEISKLLSISLKLEGMKRHVSTHAAGIVIADRPIVELAPLYKDSESDIPAVQYSMKYAEACGLVKFDFLGLKTLTVISWACNLIQGGGLDINSIPINDNNTYNMLAEGKTVGIFQFESVGMREAMKSLKPDSFEDLIALVSLYRPGPMANIPSYINRKHGLEEPEYIHPKLEDVLKETYGIIIYQEQVMQIAQILAGYSLGQADLLRRAMGKKIKAEMEAQRAIFIAGAVQNGVEEQQATDIFNLVDKFASYGFNKSHAAAYALISYQTAYLKANYTIEFLTGSLNLDIDYPDKINIFCIEAKHYGIKILPPDINRSDTYFTIIDGAIQYGFAALKNVGAKISQHIVDIRQENGPYKDIYHFLKNVEGINRKTLESLIKSGAFDKFEPNRLKLLHNINSLVAYSHSCSRQQVTLFDTLGAAEELLPSLEEYRSQTHAEELQLEFEGIGFHLTHHPLEDYILRLQRANVITSRQLEEIENSKRGISIAIAGVITSKKIKSSNKGKYAFIQLSDRFGIIELSIFDEDLVYNNNDILEVGNSLYFKANAIKDKSGLRVIAQDILTLEKGLSNIPSRYCIQITDTRVLPLLRDKIREAGNCVVRLEALLPDGSQVTFVHNQDLKMSIEDLSMLQSQPGINIIEE